MVDQPTQENDREQKSEQIFGAKKKRERQRESEERKEIKARSFPVCCLLKIHVKAAQKSNLLKDPTGTPQSEMKNCPTTQKKQYPC